MTPSKIARLLASALALSAAAGGTALAEPVTIYAGELLDGRGAVRKDVTITVEGSQIVSIESGKAASPTYDFAKMTVLPGLIDTHVHITAHFNDDERATSEGETEQEQALKWEENLYATLMGGYTTIQSIGADDDFALRKASARGRMPAPRLLTSGKPFGDPSMTPDEIRTFVRLTKAKGADVVKIFASKSSRDGGGPTLTDEQLFAACGEARRIGLRSWVHAHAASAIDQAVRAGCYAVTHARFITQKELDKAAAAGMYIEPSWGVVQQNYLAHQPNFEGIGNYRPAAFEGMKKYLPSTPPVWESMYKTQGLKILAGSDAVAGAHGHNVEELVWRVQHGQKAMDAIVDATSTDAEALGLGGLTGAIEPGMEADIIAVAGDPVSDITALRDVRFVMKGGKVYKNLNQ